MENIYDVLSDMRALYGEANSRMCSLSRMCQKLLTAIEEETHNDYPEIYSLILKYINKMYEILHDEKNQKVRKMGYDILYKLNKLL